MGKRVYFKDWAIITPTQTRTRIKKCVFYGEQAIVLETHVLIYTQKYHYHLNNDIICLIMQLLQKGQLGLLMIIQKYLGGTLILVISGGEFKGEL